MALSTVVSSNVSPGDLLPDVTYFPQNWDSQQVDVATTHQMYIPVVMGSNLSGGTSLS